MRHIDDRGQVAPMFATLVGGLFEARGRDVTAEQIKVFARALDDLPLEAVANACARALQESEYAPSPALLRKLAGYAAEDRALLAWAAFEQAAGAFGAYMSVEVEDGAAAEALLATCGSWPEYCELEEGPALAIKRQEFLAAYRRASAASRPPRRLAGLLEAQGGHAAGALAQHVQVGLIGAGGALRAVAGRVAALGARQRVRELGDGR